MSNNAGVQFYGIESILTAYVNRGVAPFAVFAGKQFLFPYVTDDLEAGRAALENFLESVSNGANVIYTLKVYEDLEDNGKIKDTTKADGSFNFQLHGLPYPERQQLRDNYNSRIGATIETRLQAIENKISGNSDATTVIDHLKDFCETEAGKIAIPQIVGSVLNFLFPGNGSATPPRLSGIDPTDEINKAIEILRRHDPRLNIHLSKLANLAETSPGNFQMLLTMLDGM